MDPIIPKDNARQASIRTELAVLGARMIALKTEFNSIAPIAVLPTEILIQIFSYVPDRGRYARSPVVDLQKLTLVCRRWSEVVPASPTLWSNITCGWRPTLKEVRIQLRRSGATPLNIEIGRLDSPDFGPLILENAQRIQSLHVAGETNLILDIMQTMRGLDFPLLQSLTLKPDKPSESDEMDIQLPLGLLEERMPLLFRLSLSYIDARWETLPPLRSLALTGGPDTRVAPLAFHVLLGILQSSPALEILKLDMMVDSDAQERGFVVKLPRLNFLYVRDFLLPCENLIANIIFPPSARLHLYPQGIYGGGDIREILIPVHKHLRAPGAPLPAVLVLSAPRDASTHFSASCFLNEADYRTFYFDGLFLINTHPTNAPALRQILVKVLKALPPHAITYLDACMAWLTSSTWKAALALLPGLEKVQLRVGDGGTTFCKAALEVGVSLRGIIIISPFRPHDVEEADEMVPFLEALTRLLQVYHMSGKPLRHLHVKDFTRSMQRSTGDERWPELRGLVGTLDVDVSRGW